MNQTTRQRNANPDDVVKVLNTLSRRKYDEFIQYYLSNYDALKGRGRYFRNFIDTCRKCLLTNDDYKHYNAVTERCVPFTRGPTSAYAELLKHIVHRAALYSKDDARKIHELLFLFEQQGVTFNIIIPRDYAVMKIFKTNHIVPGYSETADGTVQYCSVSGIVLRNGMEISNTRVNALLSKLHELGDEDDEPVPETVDGGRKRRTKTMKRTLRRNNRRCCTLHRNTRVRRNRSRSR